jgi:pimeloyl-ACP methyl ester carboxylesterase
MTGERFEVDRGGLAVVGERWRGPGPPVVLLHAGVADRRSWRGVAERLRAHADVVAYDRRGFGETPPSGEPFSHVDDLLAVLDNVGWQAAWLVGSSLGGGLAVDAALSAPDRVAGLVLIAPAISGGPEPEELDDDTARLDRLLEAAVEIGDADEINRLDTWLWLDGPAGPEGRVGGAPRALALAMNRLILGHDLGDEAGASGVDAWSRLAEVRAPASVLCGDLDLPCFVDDCRVIADRLAGARLRLLPGTAHLPYLEAPGVVADAVIDALTSATR